MQEMSLRRIGVSTFLVIFMVASPPFVQAVRNGLLSGRTVPEDRAKQGFPTTLMKKAGNGQDDASSLSMEVSAREVPGGPDPLHHNNCPSGH